MYKVYWTNFGYYSQEEFTTLDAARNYGKSKCFEHSVHFKGEMVGYWTTFGGWHTYGN